MLNIKRGINIGDHFEDESVQDEVFVNPMQEWYYGLIKQLGFDHVRLPVRWSVHTDDENGCKIDERFFSMVQQTVDRFIDMGIAVMLDVHHFRECMSNPIQHREKLALIWEQIAERFKDYPEDMLIFEILNEPDWQAKAEDWNIVQNEMISIIRKSNPTRWLMAGAVNYNEIYRMKDLELPPDDRRIIVTFHYYFPLEFTHQGAPWTTQYIDLHDIGWQGNTEQLEFMKNTLGIAVKWSADNNRPVHLGEFGAYKKANMADRARWTRALRTECERNNISWSYWELNRNFGISEPDRPTLHNELVDALLK